jgi:hypothetical protein
MRMFSPSVNPTARAPFNACPKVPVASGVGAALTRPFLENRNVYREAMM